MASTGNYSNSLLDMDMENSLGKTNNFVHHYQRLHVSDVEGMKKFAKNHGKLMFRVSEEDSSQQKLHENIEQNILRYLCFPIIQNITAQNH